MLILISLLGAVLNKFRGGSLTDISEDLLLKWGYEPVDAISIAKKYVKPFSKQLHAIVFGLLFAETICSELSLQYLICAIILYAGMIAGASFGWGNYMEAMISGKADMNRTDAPIADEVFFNLARKPVLAGWTALTIRGLMWTACIAASLVIIHSAVASMPLKAFLILPVGLSMGSVYLLSMEICQRIKGLIRGNGWQLGEFTFGAIIWGSMAYFLGV